MQSVFTYRNGLYSGFLSAPLRPSGSFCRFWDDELIMNFDPIKNSLARNRKNALMRKKLFRKNLFEGLENRYLLALDPLGVLLDRSPHESSLFGYQTSFKDHSIAKSGLDFGLASFQSVPGDGNLIPWGRYRSLSELETNLKLALTPIVTGESSWIPANESLTDDLDSKSATHLVLIDYRMNPHPMPQFANGPAITGSSLPQRTWRTHKNEGLTDVYIIGPNTSWDQINSLLLYNHHLQSLQILSHASAGKLYLGGMTIGEQNVESLENDFRDWKDSFTDDADILIYGCDFAGSEGGQDFIRKIALWTATDVTASTNPTGAESFGGNWNLEFQVGQIETPSLHLAGSQFSGLMSSMSFEDNWPSNQIQSNEPVILDFSKVTGNLDFTITASGVSISYQDQNRNSNLQLTTNSKPRSSEA